MKLVINITTLLSVISFFTIFFFPRVEGLEFIFVLPLLIFTILISLKQILILYENSIVFILILFQIIIRYLIIPMLLPFDESVYASAIKLYGLEAIFYMSLEALVIFIYMSINAKRQNLNFSLRKKNIIFILPKLKLVILLILVFIFISLSGYLNQINYIWELQAYINTKNDLQDVSTISAILFIPLRTIFSLLIISKVYKSKVNKNKKVFWLILVLLLNIIIIVGVSRFNLLLSVLPLLYILYLTFDKLRKTILYSFIGLIVPVILITSINKFQNNDIITNSEIINSKTLNAYFSGPGNVSTGVKVYYNKDNWSRTTYLFNDMAQNVPFLSKYTNGPKKTNIDFNLQIYGHSLYQDQIVPLSLNGLIHFGLFGVIFYPTIFIYIAFYFERLYWKEEFIGYKFVFIAIAISLSLIFMLNIGSMVSSIFRNLIFLFLPIYLLRKSNLFFKN